MQLGFIRENVKYEYLYFIVEVEYTFKAEYNY